MKGKVRNWIQGRGFGFLRADDGGEDIFVHVSQVEGEQPLHADQRVTFEMGTNARTGRAQAVSVRVLD